MAKEEIPYLFIVTKGIAVTDRILLDGLRKVKDGQNIDIDYQDPKKVFSTLKVEAE